MYKLPELGGEVIWAMPERNRFFLCEVFPYGSIVEETASKDILEETGDDNGFKMLGDPPFPSWTNCNFGKGTLRQKLLFGANFLTLQIWQIAKSFNGWFVGGIKKVFRPTLLFVGS